jgi:hypothetical protein
LGFLCLFFNGGFGLDGGRLVLFRNSSGILCFVSDPNIEIHNASIVSDPVMLIGSYRSFPCVAPERAGEQQPGTESHGGNAVSTAKSTFRYATTSLGADGLLFSGHSVCLTAWPTTHRSRGKQRPLSCFISPYSGTRNIVRPGRYFRRAVSRTARVERESMK